MKDDQVIMIPLERIRVVNPRCRDRRRFEKIIESIRNLGLKKPIQVSKRAGPTAADGPAYDLVCGQGRLEAFQALGYLEIPAMVVEATKNDRLLMSLVENMARRSSSPRDLIDEIERLKRAGYSNSTVGRKLDLADSMVRGLLTLSNAGEERLLVEAIKGTIPLGVAIDIAKTEGVEAQRELLTAYEGGKLNQAGIRTVRRLMAQRSFLGKRVTNDTHPRKKNWKTADGLVNALKKETQRQRNLVRKAKLCDAHLMLVVTAFRRLVANEDFTNLLRAEGLQSMPAFLAGKLDMEGAAP